MADGAAEDVVSLEPTLQRVQSLGWAVSWGGLWVHALSWKKPAARAGVCDSKLRWQWRVPTFTWEGHGHGQLPRCMHPDS